MRIVVSKSSLEVCVKNLMRVINAKNALPILADILFDVKEKATTARLTASDSEVTMSGEVMLDECEGEGSFCVNAQMLSAMLAEVNEQPVTIIATPNGDMKLSMSYSNGSAFCPIEDAEDYPMPAEEEYIETLNSLCGDWLRDTLKRSIWATATDELRFVLNGCNFALSDGRLDVAATNGHVLIKSQKDLSGKVQTDRCGSFIMPKKVANILSSIIESGDFFDFEWNNREAHISIIGGDIYFRLIEGKFPNYNSIIPKKYAHEVSCQRVALLSAAKAVAPFTSTYSQMMIMTFEGDSMEVKGENADFDSGALSSISTDGYDGKPMSVGIKASNIINVLSKLPTKDVILKLNDPTHAVVIEPVMDEESEDNLIALIMPMTLNES